MRYVYLQCHFISLMCYVYYMILYRMAVPEFLQRFSVIWLAHIGPDDWALETGLHSR